LILAGITLLAAGAAGSEGVQVKITNDGTRDIVVTVYDLNSNPQRVVLANAHINGFTSVPVNVVGDAYGRANVAWEATSNDGVSPKCGRADTSVDNDGSITVHAESSCSV
jgi:hypothetical protein